MVRVVDCEVRQSIFRFFVEHFDAMDYHHKKVNFFSLR